MSFRKRKSTGELKVFRRIAVKRGLFSEVSYKPIQQLRPENFAHILPKGRYPDARLDEDNIMIMTKEEHYLWDNNKESLRGIPIWDKVFTLERELLKTYNMNNQIKHMRYGKS